MWSFRLKHVPVLLAAFLLTVCNIIVHYKPIEPKLKRDNASEIAGTSTTIVDTRHPPFFKSRDYTFATSPWIVNDTEVERLEAIEVQRRREKESEKNNDKNKDKKYVALYESDKEKVSRTNRFHMCEYTNCEISDDFSQADAVIIFARALLLNPIQKLWKRPAKQRWVFKSNDNYLHNYGLNNVTTRSWFNWTATYKVDADLPCFMGKLRRSKNPPRSSRDLVEIYRKKTKVAAWFVSHCETWSKREEYVDRMSKVEKVDIFGHCGRLKCGSTRTRGIYDKPQCFPILRDTYKFYLAFENSFCKDYITEKFFKIFFDVSIIPVVRGGVDYNNAFPRGTFVNADDFETPEALMKYLVELGNNEKAYVNMLKEKEKWEVQRNAEHSLWCQLCKKLHTNNTVSHYDDIYKHMTQGPDECWAPRDLGPKYFGMKMDAMIDLSGSPR